MPYNGWTFVDLSSYSTEMIDRITSYNVCYTKLLRKVRDMSTSEIIEKLESMNIDFEIERFKKQAQNYISAIQLAEDHYYTQNFQAPGQEEDFIWLAIIELWNRIIPEKWNMEMIDRITSYNVCYTKLLRV